MADDQSASGGMDLPQSSDGVSLNLMSFDGIQGHEMVPLDGKGGGSKSVEKWRGNDDDADVRMDGGSEETEEPELHSLYDDIYSMLFLSHLLSPSGLYAVGIFALKFTFFAFLGNDLLTNNDPGNTFGYLGGNMFGLPPGISTTVRIAQFLMLPVAVAMQEDLIGSIFLFNVKYDPHIQHDCPGATKLKWGFASFLRMFDGLTSLAVNFFLLMTSYSVVGLFLNFAALAFLQTVDNVAYELALNGYLTDGIETVAKKVSEVSMPKLGKGCWAILDTVTFVTIFLIISIVWLTQTIRQLRGDFVCQSITAGFESNPDLGEYLGIQQGEYKKLGTLTIALHAVYVSTRKMDSYAEHGVFAYCDRNDFWSFIVTKKDPYELNQNDVCFYNLRSQELPDSYSYEITHAQSSDWVYREDGIDLPAAGFLLRCSECNINANCLNGGICEKNFCRCEEQFIGPQCQYGL